jgi:hypothetical protein
MKKRLSIAVLFLLVALMLIAAPAATTVYVTTSGTKYHTGSCRTLKKSRIAISLGDAIARGFEACKLCGPPGLDADE